MAEAALGTLRSFYLLPFLPGPSQESPASSQASQNTAEAEASAATRLSLLNNQASFLRVTRAQISQ